jgi:Rrf2 family protein
MITGKFAISVHILTLLSKFPDEYLSSDFIAGSLNINAVLVRKEIANLKKNHLVKSREGKNGGTALAQDASKISFEDILKITHEELHLGFSKNEPCPDCVVGKKINQNLESLYTDINNLVNEKLRKVSLKEFSERF